MRVLPQLAYVLRIQNFKQAPDGLLGLPVFVLHVELRVLRQLLVLEVVHQVHRNVVDHGLYLKARLVEVLEQQDQLAGVHISHLEKIYHLGIVRPVDQQLPPRVQAELLVAQTEVVRRLITALSKNLARFLDAHLSHQVFNLFLDRKFSHDVDF